MINIGLAIVIAIGLWEGLIITWFMNRAFGTGPFKDLFKVW
jgi:hypothetical protein